EEQQLHQQRGRLHPEIDAAEEARALIGRGKRLGHERLLLEVEEGRYPGHEQHEERNAEKIRRADDLTEGGPETSAERGIGLRRLLDAHRGRLCALQADHRDHQHQRHGEQRRRDRQQIDGAERHGELVSDERPDEAPGAGSRPDEAEHPSRLLAREQAGRVFGFIWAGASTGGLIGPFVAHELAVPLGAINLLPISAALLAVSLVLMIAVIRLQPTQAAAVRVGEPPQADAALGGSLWAAFGQVVRSPYLLGIALFVLLMTWVSTFLYLEQQAFVAKAFATAD